MAEQRNNLDAGRAKRAYRMQRRQDAIEQTRDRIVAAAFELHATIGPSRTTVSGIAERAGVQRHTVYAHFPDTDTLSEACTDHGMRTTRMPVPASWATIDDAAERLRQGLDELTAWYRANERMLANVLADVDPAAPPPEHPDPFDRRMGEILTTLLEPWHVEGRRRQLVAAGVGHAIAFTTWRSLAAGGLDDAGIVSILAALVEGVADGAIAADRPQARRPLRPGRSPGVRTAGRAPARRS